MPDKKKVVDIFIPQKKGSQKLTPKEVEKKTLKELQERKKIATESRKLKIRIALPKLAFPKISIPKIKNLKFYPIVKAKKLWFFGLSVLILILIFCYFSLSKANIEIFPEAEVLTFKTQLIIDKTAESTSVLNKIIPGEIIEKEKTITEQFNATGNFLKARKAEGTIKIYNEYSTYDQILLATTRFVSTEGKLFRTPVRVTIPGGKYVEGSFVPGEIDINVVAGEPGPEYNIGPTTFSIPGFAGTSRYTKFYAKSFQAMSGGSSEEASQVMQNDLERAEDELTKKVKEECQNLLQEELVQLSGYSFLDKTVQTEISESSSLTEAGTEAENFNFKVSAKSETVAFKQDDFDNFVKEFIRSEIIEGKKIYEKSISIDYTPEIINMDSGKITLSLNISAKIYSDIDISTLKNGLRGKTILETKIFLEDQQKIIKANIKLWPFWVRKVPDSLDKINFVLNLD